MRACAFIICVAVLAAAGCDWSKTNMDDQGKADTHEGSRFFADGTVERPAVAGAVARPGDDVPGWPYAVNGPPERAGNASVVPPDQANPFPITREVVERGRERFDITCSLCHGRLGNGDGMIVQRGFSRPPSFHAQRLKDAPDAHFYNVMTHGYGAMFSYSDRITPDDRWKIVAYIRTLQAASDEELPSATRAALMAGGDPNAPKGGGR